MNEGTVTERPVALTVAEAIRETIDELEVGYTKESRQALYACLFRFAKDLDRAFSSEFTVAGPIYKMIATKLYDRPEACI